MFDSLKQDSRPKFHGWAPGNYIGTCNQCGEQFQGDKRAIICADCAYSDVPEGFALVPVEPNDWIINEMVDALMGGDSNNAEELMKPVYKAMLNAAKGE